MGIVLQVGFGNGLVHTLARWWSARLVIVASLLFATGCSGGDVASGNGDPEQVGVNQQALIIPGQPGGECGGFVEKLANGDVRFAVKFPAAQRQVEVFARKNGSQNVAQPMLGFRNADGTFTYRYVAPASLYRSGDKITARFYSFVANQPGVFTPGPTQSTWLNDFTYGSSACDISGAPLAAGHPHIQMLSNGAVKLSVTLPNVQKYVEVFVRLNGVQDPATNIVSSAVPGPPGSSTFSLVLPANRFKHGDQLIARFYSYKQNAPGVFTPGPEENVWSPLFVYQVVHPFLQCVRKYKSPQATALFGYENTSSVAVTIPAGAGNQLVPGGSAGVPTTFLPGRHEQVFWGNFDVNVGTAWSVVGDAAAAAGTSTACALGDTMPGSVPKPLPAVVAIDRPQISMAALSGQISPDVSTPALSHLAGEIHGPERGFEAGNSSNEELGTGPFTFTVNSLHFTGGEGACGTVDPFVANLNINGVDKGASDSGTVQVPRGQRFVHVRVDIDDDDDFLCFGDEDLAVYDLDIDLYTASNNVCHDGDKMCFTTTALSSPDLCFDWNGQFVDAGPWDGAPAEDFLVGKGIQTVPASFARYRIQMLNGTQSAFDRGGVLDENGCVPGGKLPIREHWQLGTDLKVFLRLISQHCLDPSGTECASTGTPPTLAGANVVITQGDQTGPAELCAVFAENPASITDPKCVVRPITWAAVPPSPLRPVFLDNNSITRTGAVFSQMFRREHVTGGSLGIVRAMVDRRLEGTTTPGRVGVKVDKFCDITDACTGATLQTSCRSGEDLILEPDAALPASTRFKYIVAHEFGHFIQGNGQGLMAINYGCGPGDPNQPALCRCDAIPVDQQLHCLQSMEEPNAAQIEGFAQYFAAKVFNEDAQADCTFAYYKPIANTSCFPGAASCEQNATTGLWVSQPPIPVSCRQAVRWRNSHCVDAQSSPDLLAFGTEFDWLQFLYGVSNAAIPTQRWSTAQLFDAYVLACGDGTVAGVAECEDKRVSWKGSATHKSLSAGAVLMAAAGFHSQAATDQFLLSGDTFGVSDKP